MSGLLVERQRGYQEGLLGTRLSMSWRFTEKGTKAVGPATACCPWRDDSKPAGGSATVVGIGSQERKRRIRGHIPSALP
jgi:hypothetical protein